MNSIFLFLSVTIAFASVTSFLASSTPVVVAAVQTLCQTITTEPILATIYYNQLTTALNANQNAETLFPQTLAYINDPTEKNALLAGGDSCIQFFAGLTVPLVADLQATGLSPQSIVQKLAQYVENIITIILADRV